MHIFDTVGMRKVHYWYCACVDGLARPTQLLDAGWHPAATDSDCCQTWALIAQLEKLGENVIHCVLVIYLLSVSASPPVLSLLAQLEKLCITQLKYNFFHSLFVCSLCARLPQRSCHPPTTSSHGPVEPLVVLTRSPASELVILELDVLELVVSLSSLCCLGFEQRRQRGVDGLRRRLAEPVEWGLAVCTGFAVQGCIIDLEKLYCHSQYLTVATCHPCMPPLPSLLWSLACFAHLTVLTTPGAQTQSIAFPWHSQMAPASFVRFRASQAVDANVGFDGADPVTDISADRGVYFSNDGRRHVETLLNVEHKKPHVTPGNLDDRWAEWLPVDDSHIELDRELLEQMDKVSGTGKRKRYESSDDPMAQWRREKQFFLDETLRREGLGDSMVAPDPLHLLEEWTGEFWKKTTLDKIGLVYHIGHGGRRCRTPTVGLHRMVVIDTTGIHTVSFQYCGCSRNRGMTNLQLLLRNGWYPASLTDPSTCATFRVLDHFRLLNVVANVNAHDFILTLERQTDALGTTGLRWMPDRYRAFSRIARQWVFIQRVRRAGRAHDAAMLDATTLGELMVICWRAHTTGETYRRIGAIFLYMLILALDTNFKLKNRIRANERHDPSLGPGWGAFVEPTAYKEHLRNYVGETDISTCIAFAALLQKDTCLTTGLRTSGVGGCVCARHECVRPNGLGDLQKGERYANMDYIVMSCLAGFALMMLTISYDIACQWKKNLSTRNKLLPEAIQLDLDNVEVQCGLPVWHASSHELECNNENSLSFLAGVGKSDGEGVERTWADLNPAAFHTKEMGIGNRADTLEDKIDSHNFLKNLAQGDALPRKLLVALAERTRQVDAFKEVNRTVPKELQTLWQAQIDTFVADHRETNPYALPKSGAPTESELQLSLKREEEEEIRQGRARLHATSATAFLSAGIQLEDAQRRIRAEVAGRALVTADRASKLHDRRVAFKVKLAKFRKLQEVFTPGAIRTLRVDHAADLSETPEVGCLGGVVALEIRLRENQCHNALVQLRAHLHTKHHLIGFRNTQITGQVKATKARTLIAQVGERAQACSDKYTQACGALTRLAGADFAPHFKVLKAADIALDGEEETSETAARKRLAMAGAGKGARLPRHVAGTSKKVLSWIWTAAGALDDDEKALHESLRVEWCRAKARKRRWEEEVLILREEMRRVLRYLEWQAAWWIARAAPRSTVAAPLQAGLEAYARRQAHTYTELQPLEEGADLVALFT
ncbi:hypothetical protein C8R46DRAFT_1238052 [Mycena filopes]|nr:hypothetical protein C8R46DRAFT_1238052 [Mycena filopes]